MIGQIHVPQPPAPPSSRRSGRKGPSGIWPSKTMAITPFLSYVPSDGKQFAFWLSMELGRSNRPIRPWLDETSRNAGEDWVEVVAEAIQTCSCLLLILTSDAGGWDSRCREEWRRALKYKKPVAVLGTIPDASIPVRLEHQRFIDFTGDKSAGLRDLIEWLWRIDSPAGQLEHLNDQLRDAERDLTYAQESSTARVKADIETLTEQIERLQHAVNDPQAVTAEVEKRIDLALELQRSPKRAPREVATLRFINQAPVVAPRYFQNRFHQTQLIADFLRDSAARLMTVTGRGGVGKTALVCRALKALEAGKLPDDLGELRVAGILYLAATGSREITFSNLFLDLMLLVEPKERKAMVRLSENPQATVQTKLRALLPQARRVLQAIVVGK